MIAGAVQACGGVTCAVFVRKAGKRKMAFSSLFAATLTCFLLATYVYSGLRIPWIPMFIFFVSFYFAGLGVVPLPWIIVCEVFPLE